MVQISKSSASFVRIAGDVLVIGGGMAAAWAAICAARAGAQVDKGYVGTSGAVGADSGWNEWADDPRYQDRHWYMGKFFRRARGVARAA